MPDRERLTWPKPMLWRVCLYLFLAVFSCQQLSALDIGPGDDDGLGDDLQLEEPQAEQAVTLDPDAIAVTWLSNLADWVDGKDRQGDASIVKLSNQRRGVRLVPGSSLERKTAIPQSGQYRIWISYRPTPGTATPFELKVEGAKELARTFGDFSLDYMLSGKELEQRHPVRYESEHYRVLLPVKHAIIWEFWDVELQEGESTFALSAPVTSPSPPVESLLVTRSKAFAPSRSTVHEERTLDRVFLRVRVHGHEGPVGVGRHMRLTYMNRFSGPGRYHDYFWGAITTGRLTDSAESDTLTPGRWSTWVDATTSLTTGGYFAMGGLSFTPLFDGRMEVQFAWYPNAGAAAKSVTTSIRRGRAYVLLPVSPQGFHMPGDQGWTAAAMIDDKLLGRFRSLEQLEADMDRMTTDALAKVGGPIPPLQYLDFHASLQGPLQVVEAALPRVSSMGIAHTSVTLTEKDVARDLTFPQTFWLSYSGIGFSPDRQAAIEATAAKWLKIRQAEGEDAVRYVKLGDEIGYFAGSETINSSPEGLALFHGFLADELARLGKTPAFLGVDDLTQLRCSAPDSSGSSENEDVGEDTLPPPAEMEVSLPGTEAVAGQDVILEEETATEATAPSHAETPAGKAEKRRLEALSRRFIPWLTAWYYRGKTAAVRQAFPEANTFTNHATGFMWSGRFSPLWFTNCRYQGTTMACAEDWAWPSKGGTASCGIQTVSFYGAIMDCAAREHGNPKGFQTIATSNHAARKIFSLVGEGVFFQDLYHYGPPYFRSGGTMDCWAHKHWVYSQVTQALAALRPAEKRIVSGKPEPARVAIVANLSDDWRDDRIPGMLDERLLVYLALRHAGYPVDLLLERDLRRQSNVELARYKAIYLTGVRLEREGFETLQEWCRNGGTLLVSALAASQDEFGDAVHGADEVVGARRQVQGISAGRWHPDFISDMAPLDHVGFPEGAPATARDVPVVGLKIELQPRQESRVLATFSDGSPALCARDLGQGRILTYGFMPGMSYRFGTVREKGKIAGYRDDIRAIITEPVRQACGDPLVVESSEPLVETSVFADDQGMAVLLNDFTWQGERDLRLRIRSTRPVVKASLTLGAIRDWRQHGDMVELLCSAPDPVTVVMLEYGD